MDEAGTSSTLTFDAFGGVLDNTLPAEVQTALAGQGLLADPDTGLIHQGGGRFYDPTLGRPLQPNSFGGLPTVPQTLNRYAATSMGAPGVAEGADGGYNSTVDLVNLAKALAIGYPMDKLGQSIKLLTGYQFASEVTYWVPALNRKMTLHTNIRLGNFWQRLEFGNQYRNILKAEAEAKLTTALLSLEARDIDLVRQVQHDGTPILTILDDIDGIGSIKGYSIIKGFLGFGFDALIAGTFEAYDIWDDPFYTADQKRRRIGVVGVTNALGSAAGVGIAGLVCTTPLAPGCIALSFVFGTIGALTSDAVLTEPFSQIVVGPRERKLRPLSQ